MYIVCMWVHCLQHAAGQNCPPSCSRRGKQGVLEDLGPWVPSRPRGSGHGEWVYCGITRVFVIINDDQ